MKNHAYSSEELALLEHLPVPLALWQLCKDRPPEVFILSDGYLRLFGFADKESALACSRQDLYRYTHPHDIAEISLAFSRFNANDRPFDVLFRARKPSDSAYHVIHATGERVTSDTGLDLLSITFTDEGLWSGNGAEQEADLPSFLLHSRQKEGAARSVRYDHLTGLPGMTYFFELVNAGRAALLKSGHQTAILYIDLCGMKFFNRKYGFAEGDRLLCAFSALLSGMFGNDCCCRFGSDHFVVFTEARDLKARLNQLFEDALKLNNGLTLPVRVGIYLEDAEEIAPSTACDHAKAACDSLRNSYTSRFNYYTPEMQKSAEWRQYIITNLDRAIREQWIQVYYQPIVRAVSGKICDDEALCRWIDPVHGLLSPIDFIPVLEEASLIYRLDLYVLEQVLLKIRRQSELGMYLVPQSINLSRSDFESCDIVEEVRRRVDAAGVRPEMITVEITESTLGSNFEFMKEQIMRFRALGFPVWMDDFGSGYSSLDVLQSIHFDLIKFDMGFMKRLNEGENGKIILTQLVRMATNLRIDTVCEGVETRDQVNFLREIGCSKLQGYYFSKPVSFDAFLEKSRESVHLEYENPSDSAYFEILGRVDLFDLNAISNTGNGRDAFLNFFDTFPMAILEMKDDTLRYTRTNTAFRHMNTRFFNFDVLASSFNFVPFPFPADSILLRSLRECRKNSEPILFDDQMPDGSFLHAFIRCIAHNPSDNTSAFVIAILSISEKMQDATYSSIARALATNYYHIYYVDLQNDQYIEYSSSIGAEELALERHGTEFFGNIRQRVSSRIYEEDREMFFRAFTRENILKTLEQQGFFSLVYRLLDTGVPMYVAQKIVYPLPDKQHIVIGISIIDAQMKQKADNDRMHREIQSYGRMIALIDGLFAFYTVDPDSGRYIEFNSTADYQKLGIGKTGDHFFEESRRNSLSVIHPDDQPSFIRQFTRENVLDTIRKKGSFDLRYHLMMNGVSCPTILRAVLVNENDGEKIIVGLRRISQQSGS